MRRSKNNIWPRVCARPGQWNIDHRLRQRISALTLIRRCPGWGNVADLATQRRDLLVGSWLRGGAADAQPPRQAVGISTAAVMAINLVAYDFNYDLDVDIVCAPSAMAAELAGVAAALGADTLGLAR